MFSRAALRAWTSPLSASAARCARAAGARAPTGTRALSLHEYLSMEMLATHGVTVPRGAVAATPAAAAAVARDILSGSSTGGAAADVVIKAQALTGGRGLGTFASGFRGGVHMVTSAKQAEDIARKMLGQRLITKQTGEAGRPVDKIFLVERLYLRKEMYLSVMLDRAYNGAVIIACAAGGTSIEDLAQRSPESIIKVPVDLTKGVQPAEIAKVVAGLELTGKVAIQAGECVRALWKLFVESDASLIEVNPLAETPDGRIVVCDAKINFDDNAAFRQAAIFAKRDFSQEDPREVEASKWDLNYIGLDGTIGCMVNGAGLAMATMDIIKLHGGAPANFLDVGGGASAEQVTHAFEILNADPKVQAILVNIFGGIMRCDVIAQGVVAAAKKIGLKKPVVLRLQGTNVKEAKAFIETSGYKIIMQDDLDKAAAMVVKVAAIKKAAEEIALDVSFELPL